MLHTALPTKSVEDELMAIEKRIDELSAPIMVLEAEIAQIRSAIERGKALAVSDHAEFLEQGGNRLIAEISAILKDKLISLETLRAETRNLQQPLQITKSNLLALLVRRREKSLMRKERECHRREYGESPINLARWVNRVRTKPTLWKVIAMAQKREDQILAEICQLYRLEIVSKKELSAHYARKYRKYRLRRYRRGYYLIPADEPKGRNKNIEKYHESATDEFSKKSAR